jgi:hypothetical protein
MNKLVEWKLRTKRARMNLIDLTEESNEFK